GGAGIGEAIEPRLGIRESLRERPDADARGSRTLEHEAAARRRPGGARDRLQTGGAPAFVARRREPELLESREGLAAAPGEPCRLAGWRERPGREGRFHDRGFHHRAAATAG